MSYQIKSEKLKELENELIDMCRKVEVRLKQAIDALINKNFELAREIFSTDHIIDNLERDIEQRCLKLLLLEHPYAGEFKEVSAILKMITDLERIGDQSSDIAEITLMLDEKEYIKDLSTIEEMSDIVISMVKDSVNAYVLRDLKLAKEVINRDNRVDDIFDLFKTILTENLKNNNENINAVIDLIMIAKYLERIADHSVNICEWTNYTVYGKRD